MLVFESHLQLYLVKPTPPLYTYALGQMKGYIDAKPPPTDDLEGPCVHCMHARPDRSQTRRPPVASPLLIPNLHHLALDSNPNGRWIDTDNTLTESDVVIGQLYELPAALVHYAINQGCDTARWGGGCMPVLLHRLFILRAMIAFALQGKGMVIMSVCRPIWCTMQLSARAAALTAARRGAGALFLPEGQGCVRRARIG